MRSFLCICSVLTFNSALGLLTTSVTYIASCPWVTEKTYCTAYISTPERMVTVTVTMRTGKKIHKVDRLFVARFDLVQYPMPGVENKTHHDIHDFQTHHVRVFRAVKPFRVIVHTRDQTLLQSDSIVLTPKSNCYNSYYIVTGFGNPFFTIFTFESLKTEILVSCPEFDRSLDMSTLNCPECEACINGKATTITMFEYEAWHFKLDHEDASLLNVQITTDFPVYVVSGNSIFGWSKIKTGTKDITTTSLKPSTTWGKYYIVPNFGSDTPTFVINCLYTPFMVTFQDLVSLDGKMDAYTVTSSQKAVYEHKKTTNPLRITAQDPFGLYQLFPSTLNFPELGIDASILSLIPVEQWKRGNTYVFPHRIPEYKLRYFLAAKAPLEDIVFSIDVQRKDLYIQKTTAQDIHGQTYTVAEINVGNLNGTIYVNNTQGRMIIYVTMTPKLSNILSLATYPNDFYQAEIYQKKCEPSYIVHAHDGIDNDCDDYVDEEIKNGVDDDGDGSVDEDYVEPFSDGQWTQWAHACNESILNDTIVVRVRSCLDKSIYGRDCDGLNTQCDESSCDLAQLKWNDISNQSKCFCDAGCLSCDRNIFQCQGCKPGYAQTEHCLIRCKKGSTGYNCMDTLMEKNSFPLAYVFAAVVAMAFLVFLAVYSSRLTSSAATAAPPATATPQSSSSSLQSTSQIQSKTSSSMLSSSLNNYNNDNIDNNNDNNIDNSFPVIRQH